MESVFPQCIYFFHILTKSSFTPCPGCNSLIVTKLIIIQSDSWLSFCWGD